MSKFSFLKNRNSILVIVAIVAVVITGGLIYANSNPGFSLFGKSDNQIGSDVVKYINDNQLAQTPATLVKVSEASGLVKVTIKIGTSQFDSYATKDGKLLFPQAFDMTPRKTATTAGSTTTTPTATAASVTKVDKPVLEAYVVSSCPYGLQMQRALAEAVKNAPALASNIIVRYIGSVTNGQINSMHDSDASGKAVSNGPEAKENLRQICIRDEQPTKYWNYVACYMKKASGTLPNGMPLGDSTGCLASTGVDTAKLNACVSTPSRGIADAQKDFDLGTKYNVSGSPTLILDGAVISESDFGGRSADAVRSIVCTASKTQPGLCSTKLNTAEASVSFNASYATSGAAASSANTNCAPAAQ